MSISICCANLDYISMEQLRWTINILSEYTVNRVQKYKYVADKKRCLVGELLTRYMLIEKYGFTNRDLVFDRTIYGQPYIRNCKDIYFSISHSGKLVICAISDHPIGVDLELICHQKYENSEIAKYYFSDYENERIACEYNLAEKEIEFYKIWTLKESYLKVLGMGLYKELNSFEIRMVNGENKIFEEGKEKDNYILINKIYNKEYALSICINDVKNERIKRFCIGMIEQIELAQIRYTIEMSL